MPARLPGPDHWQTGSYDASAWAEHPRKRADCRGHAYVGALVGRQGPAGGQVNPGSTFVPMRRAANLRRSYDAQMGLHTALRNNAMCDHSHPRRDVLSLPNGDFPFGAQEDIDPRAKLDQPDPLAHGDTITYFLRKNDAPDDDSSDLFKGDGSAVPLESDDIVLVFDGRSIHTRWVEPPPAILSRRDLTFDRGRLTCTSKTLRKIVIRFRVGLNALTLTMVPSAGATATGPVGLARSGSRKKYRQNTAATSRGAASHQMASHAITIAAPASVRE